MITDPAAAVEYCAANYWNEFLDPSKTYPCDTNIVNGVASEDVETALGTFVTILEEQCSREFSAKAVRSLFDQVERFQAADTTSNVFAFFEKMVPYYLYDPNSPVRDEDLYYEYVTKLAGSAYSDQDLVWSYSHDAQMCLLNKVGTHAADFSFTALDGSRHTLYGVDAPLTLLFFSNPGCTACGEIIEQLCNDPLMAAMSSAGALAVVNIYIDNELDKWKEYASTYPEDWFTGYDHTHTIRNDITYNVRAIPSLYLLDADKTVLLKDATTERVIRQIHQASQTIQ